ANDLPVQVEAQLQVMQKLEEKQLPEHPGTMEKELSLHLQGLELHKRKVMEAAQLAKDLRVQGEHIQARLQKLQVCAAGNQEAKAKESLSLKRAQ
ncbi:BRE1B ligase, partial [Chloropsis hardwickii]|nr:BRE1B ligase [Chloropsis hardwickii]